VERIIESIAKKKKYKHKYSILKSRINGQLIVDIKALYLWSYNLEEIFEKCYLSSKLNLEELKRVCLIRHLFITHYPKKVLHKNKNHFFTAELWTGFDSEDIKINFAPLIHRKNHFLGLNKLKKRLRNYFPDFLQIKNRHLEVTYLYEKINLIPDLNLKRDVEQFLGGVGIRTERPSKILEVLFATLKQYSVAAFS
jgi:hypothetical protein